MKNKAFVQLISFYLIYSISQGILLPFVNIYYDQIGLTGMQIGQIGSLSLIGTMMVLPLWGILTDYIKKYKWMLVLSLILTLIMTYLWKLQSSYSWILLFSILMSIFRGVTMPVCDSASLLFCKLYHKDYGLLRSMSSLGYVLGSVVIVKAADYLGYSSPLVCVYLGVIFIALIIALNYPKIEQEKEKEKKGAFIEDLKVLLKNKAYLFILFLAAFNNIPLESASVYIGNHFISAMHLSSSSMSTYLIFATLPEIAFIMIVSKLFRNYGYKKIYLIASITQILRGIVYTLTSSFPLFLLVSVVQMIMVGVASVGNFGYISKVIPPRLTTSAMSIYSAFVMIVTAVYTQLFGFIYDDFGSHSIFLVMTLLNVVGLVILLGTKRFDHIR
ncbi:MFS transporter [Beduini massiliensis]|uniref:MFS transporter n=1 Tax=Beduini massiliensis TaxID=1585974 RepID=UPI00059A8DAD|nr:MFS transporter [Beduini massiliensis]